MMVVDKKALLDAEDDMTVDGRVRMFIFQLVYHLETARTASGVPKLHYLFPAASKADGVGVDKAIVLLFDGRLLPLSTVRDWLPHWEEEKPGSEKNLHGYYACSLAKAMDQAIGLEAEQGGRFHMLHHFSHVLTTTNVVVGQEGQCLVGGLGGNSLSRL